MKKIRNLPNLSKQIKKLIGKMTRENNRLKKQSTNKNYDMRKDKSLYSFKFNSLSKKGMFITKSSHSDFIKLLNNFELVFDYKNIRYNTNQIAFKLDEFITTVVFKNEPYNLDMINEFIKRIEVPDYVIYFFRLFNFDYQEKVNLGSDIMIISGKEVLNDIPKDLNRKAEENPTIKTLIQPKDILLAVSVIGSGKSDESYYHALDFATRVNNLINFLNGFNHKPSQVLELNQHIIQENGLYQFTYKRGRFSTKQTPGVIKGDWSTSTGVNPDKRKNANLNFDKRWLSNIPLIVEESNELSPLQKQCARAIDWIGDGIVNSNQTKQFLQIIISLETMIEQDPDQLKAKLKKDRLWKDGLSVSIEDQIVSIMNLICYPGVEEKQLKTDDAAIKNAYELRSQITHNGKKLSLDASILLNRWYDLAYTIISEIIFSEKWNNVYDLWKAANLK